MRETDRLFNAKTLGFDVGKVRFCQGFKITIEKYAVSKPVPERFFQNLFYEVNDELQVRTEKTGSKDKTLNNGKGH